MASAKCVGRWSSHFTLMLVIAWPDRIGIEVATSPVLERHTSQVFLLVGLFKTDCQFVAMYTVAKN